MHLVDYYWKTDFYFGGFKSASAIVHAGYFAYYCCLGCCDICTFIFF